MRFNSAAAEISPAPLETPSYSRISESDSNQITNDQQTAIAEELLNAHNASQETVNYTPVPYTEVDSDESYAVAGNTNGGVFYQLLQAYKTPVNVSQPASTSQETTKEGSPSRPGSSGVATPSRKKWYKADSATRSQETLATLIGASALLANPNDKKHPVLPTHKRNSSGGVLAKVWKAKEDKDARIKIHVANILKRQQYIIRMCRALMLFGAPTHRLEEYLATTAKILEVNSQFLYIPGCMIISCKYIFEMHSGHSLTVNQSTTSSHIQQRSKLYVLFRVSILAS